MWLERSERDRQQLGPSGLSGLARINWETCTIAQTNRTGLAPSPPSTLVDPRKARNATPYPFLYYRLFISFAAVCCGFLFLFLFVRGRSITLSLPDVPLESYASSALMLSFE